MKMPPAVSRNHTATLFEQRLEQHKQNLLDCVAAFEDHATNLRRAQEDLQESEETVRALFENASQGIITADASGRIAQVNAMAAELFGYSRDEMIGSPIEMLLPDALRAAHETYRGKYFREPRTRTMGTGLDLSARRKDGSEFPVEISLSHVTTKRGVLAVAFVSDITERKRAEAALRESEETVRALLESASQAIVGVNSDGLIVLVNAMAVQLFKYEREELLGKPLEILVPTRVAERHAAYRKNYVREPHRRPMGIGIDLSARRKDGSEFPVEISLSSVQTQHGVLAVSFITDITERKRAEEALLGQAQELARSNADLQQFAFATSHDLQEPLRMISGYAQLIEMKYSDTLDDAMREYIGYMVEGTQRLEALIQDMLAFSRVANVESVPRTVVSLDATVEWALQNLAVSIQESGAIVEVKPLGSIMGNQIQLVQLFQNLIGNAIKHTQAGTLPKVRIWSEREDGKIVLTVEDNGPGIDPKYHEHVFGVFKRLSRDTPGTGIGLALCRRIVDKHHGRVWVESAGREGSKFRVALPAGLDAESQERRVS
jgi:PAS domain S-box-containing protein